MPRSDFRISPLSGGDFFLTILIKPDSKWAKGLDLASIKGRGGYPNVDLIRGLAWRLLRVRAGTSERVRVRASVCRRASGATTCDLGVFGLTREV